MRTLVFLLTLTLSLFSCSRLYPQEAAPANPADAAKTLADLGKKASQFNSIHCIAFTTSVVTLKLRIGGTPVEMKAVEETWYDKKLGLFRYDIIRENDVSTKLLNSLGQFDWLTGQVSPTTISGTAYWNPNLKPTPNLRPPPFITGPPVIDSLHAYSRFLADHVVTPLPQPPAKIDGAVWFLLSPKPDNTRPMNPFPPSAFSLAVDQDSGLPIRLQFKGEKESWSFTALRYETDSVSPESFRLPAALHRAKVVDPTTGKPVTLPPQ